MVDEMGSHTRERKTSEKEVGPGLRLEEGKRKSLTRSGLIVLGSL